MCVIAWLLDVTDSFMSDEAVLRGERGVAGAAQGHLEVLPVNYPEVSPSECLLSSLSLCPCKAPSRWPVELERFLILLLKVGGEEHYMCLLLLFLHNCSEPSALMKEAQLG